VERDPTEDGGYLGFAGPLATDGRVSSPRRFEAQLENLVLAGNDVYGAFRQLGISTVHRFDPQILTLEAVCKAAAASS
jgi:hypothetical protein